MRFRGAPVVALSRGDVCERVCVLRIEPKRVLSQLPHTRPIVRREGGVSLVEHAVNLALETFGWHVALSCASGPRAQPGAE